MCGIAGIVTQEGHICPDQMAHMRDALAHRGPDDAGIWLNDSHTVGLAHRRLSIIDLSQAGHQPMGDESRRVWIVYNGEIYNFPELRNLLESHGHRFKTRTDTEVIINAYLQWGKACVEHLNGMFAFGIWDEATRELFLARDRIGKKPLYYYHKEGLFAFASECKAILPVLGGCKLDPQAVNAYFAFGYVSGELSIFEGIKRLLPGHFMLYQPEVGFLQTRRYWEPPIPSLLPDKRVGEEVLLSELEDLLQDSVRIRLMADVPVGILLSGGLDSSLVTAMAARVSPSAVKTFTIGFPGGGKYDETAHAAIVARQFGTEHHVLPLEATVGFDTAEAVAQHLDEPLADPSIIPTYLVSQLTRRHVTVALGGDGGDELFGGYRWYRAGLLAERRCQRLPHWFRAAVASAALRLPTGLKGRNYLLSHAHDLSFFMCYGRSVFHPTDRSRLFASTVLDRLKTPDIERPEEDKGGLWLEGRDSVANMTLLDLKTFLPDDILFKLDRASMAFGLEVRAPWLDHRIVELAMHRVPSCLKVDLNGDRYLQRALGVKTLPHELDLQRKQGFVMPVHIWMRGTWGDFTMEVATSSRARQWIKPAYVAALLRGQRRGFSNGLRLFACLMFSLWLEGLDEY